MAASTSVNISVNLRDGTKENISHSVSQETGVISYPNLLHSLNSVQDQCNRLLTKAVEEEKSRSKVANLNSNLHSNSEDQNDGSSDDDEDEDDDDDENGEAEKEPPPKKHKS